MLTEDDVRELARLRMKQYAVTRKGKPRKGSSGFTNFCRKFNVQKSHASQFMNGRARPNTDLLEALGLYRCYAHKED